MVMFWGWFLFFFKIVSIIGELIVFCILFVVLFNENFVVGWLLILMMRLFVWILVVLVGEFFKGEIIISFFV